MNSKEKNVQSEDDSFLTTNEKFIKTVTLFTWSRGENRYKEKRLKELNLICNQYTETPIRIPIPNPYTRHNSGPDPNPDINSQFPYKS